MMQKPILVLKSPMDIAVSPGGSATPQLMVGGKDKPGWGELARRGFMGRDAGGAKISPWQQTRAIGGMGGKLFAGAGAALGGMYGLADASQSGSGAGVLNAPIGVAANYAALDPSHRIAGKEKPKEVNTKNPLGGAVVPGPTGPPPTPPTQSTDVPKQILDISRSKAPRAGVDLVGQSPPGFEPAPAATPTTDHHVPVGANHDSRDMVQAATTAHQPATEAPQGAPAPAAPAAPAEPAPAAPQSSNTIPGMVGASENLETPVETPDAAVDPTHVEAYQELQTTPLGQWGAYTNPDSTFTEASTTVEQPQVDEFGNPLDMFGRNALDRMNVQATPQHQIGANRPGEAPMSERQAMVAVREPGQNYAQPQVRTTPQGEELFPTEMSDEVNWDPNAPVTAEQQDKINFQNQGYNITAGFVPAFMEVYSDLLKGMTPHEVGSLASEVFLKMR